MVKTRKDFAIMCDMTKAALDKAVQRGSVDVNEFGSIDTTAEKNAMFLAKQTGKSVGDKKEGFESLTRRKERLQVEKLQKEVELLELKERKMRAELVPKDMMKSVFAIYAKSSIESYIRSAEDLAGRFVKRMGGDRSDLADFRRLMNESVNEGIKEAKELALKELDNLSENLAEERGKGERE